MDRRHLKILMLACLGLAPAGLGNVRSQEPGGAGFRPRRGPGPMVMPQGENVAQARLRAEQEAYRNPEQLQPEDRENFNRNLEAWRVLRPEEQAAISNLAHARVRAEIDKAVQDSGLHLDADQREMFALRYRQERRKLERDLQRQAAAERSRRMPEIIARLRGEFGGAPANSQASRPEGSPASSAKPEANGATAVNPGPALSR